jgi:hypothetical protein
MGEVPLKLANPGTIACAGTGSVALALQGYLAHKKTPTPWDHHKALGTGLL